MHALKDDGVVMLAICGTYQLFGHRFVTGKNESINGIGLLDVETFAGQDRLIGNITTETEFGKLVGYENHSGLTYVGEGAKAFGKVLGGAGNNLSDNTEGAVDKNVFGTYLHGPILPKNAQFADELLLRALERKYGPMTIESIDDSLENEAHFVASSRPR